MESRSVILAGHLFQCKKETKESAVLVLFFLSVFQSRFGLFIFSIISFLMCADLAFAIILTT